MSIHAAVHSGLALARPAPGEIWRDTSFGTANYLGHPYSGRDSYTTLSFDNKMWIIGGKDNNNVGRNDVWYSFDGTTWIEATACAAFSPRFGHASVVFDNKMWVIGGYGVFGDFGAQAQLSDVWCSSDGVNWTQATASAAFGARYGHAAVVFHGKMWIVGGVEYDSDTWFSSDGVTWTLAVGSHPWVGRGEEACVVYDDKIWLIGGGDVSDIHRFRGDVWYTSDGLNWTEATAAASFPPRGELTSLVYDGKMWVIGGRSQAAFNDVWFSSDGVAWTSATLSAAFSPRYDTAGVVFGGRMWVFGSDGSVGTRGDAWSSADGATWLNAAISVPPRSKFSPRYQHTSVAFHNKMWVIGGRYDSLTIPYNDVWNSADGTSWTQVTAAAPFKIRYGHTSLVFNDEIWVIAGNATSTEQNDVWHSPDGLTWTEATNVAPFHARYGHTSVVFDDKMWVMGGSKGDWIDQESTYDDWWSTDGTNWTQVTGPTTYGPRRYHASVVYGGYIWVISGVAGGTDAHDAYRSSDGGTWTRTTWTLPFAADGHSALVYKDRMQVIGGSMLDRPCTIWSSSDGTTWTRTTKAAAFGGRWYHTGVVFDNKMWVIGGEGNYGARNDVWCSGDDPAARTGASGVDLGRHDIYAGPRPPVAVQLRNSYPEGWVPLTVQGVSIQNDATGAFSLAAATPTTGTLLVGDRRDFPVVFNPKVSGPATADLVFTTDDPTSPVLTVRLSGFGVTRGALTIY